MRFLPFAGGQAGHHRPGSERVRIAHVTGFAGPVGKTAGMFCEAFSGFVLSSAGEVCPFTAASADDFVFHYWGHTPAR